MVNGASLDARSVFFDPFRSLTPWATPSAERPLPERATSRDVRDGFELGSPWASLFPFSPFTRAAERGRAELDPFALGQRLAGTSSGRELGTLSSPPRAHASRTDPPTTTSRTKRRPRRISAERRRWNHWAKVVRQHGGKVCPGNKPTILGLRHIDGASSRYGDTFVVLTPNHRVRVFHGSTHPGQSSSSAATDANHDGVGDVGMLRPGNYRVVANGPHDGEPSFHVLSMRGSDNVNGWRDTNHDGHYSRRERRASAHRGDTLSEILFHVGLSGSPSSIGCQNIPPAVYDRFVRAVGGPRASFSFTLVDAT